MCKYDSKHNKVILNHSIYATINHYIKTRDYLKIKYEIIWILNEGLVDSVKQMSHY